MAVAARPLLGIALVVVATMVFATGDVLTKDLTSRYDVPFVGAVRYVLNMVGIMLLFGRRSAKEMILPNRPLWVLMRSICLVAATFCMGFALQRMPVPETISIVFLAPFGVMLLSGPLLGETVTRANWIAASVGFFGVLLIIRPGTGLDPVGILFALGTALATVAYNMLSRFLSGSSRTNTLLFQSALVGSIVFCATLPWSAPAGPLPVFDWGLLLVLGVVTILGHYLFTAAFREAPASVLAPVNYAHVLWASLLAWAVFGHIPDPVTLAGMAAIVGSGVGVTVFARLSR